MDMAVLCRMLCLLMVLCCLSIGAAEFPRKRFILDTLSNLLATDTELLIKECIRCHCNGHCLNVAEDRLCQQYYDSIECSHAIHGGTCPPHHCQGSADCYQLSKTGRVCVCRHGYTGPHCSPIDSGSTSSPTTTTTSTTATTTTTTTPVPVLDFCSSSPCGIHGQCSYDVNGYNCSCNQGWIGKNCETDPVPTCIHDCALEPVVNGHSVFNYAASKCSSTHKSSDEAILMTCCGLGAKNTWQEGVQVISKCTDGSAQSEYIPIASFQSNQPVNGTAGVFVGCVDNGFRYIRQTCDTVAEFVTVDGRSGIDPSMFYVVHVN